MSALEAAMDLRSGNVLGLLSSGKDAINALTAISKDLIAWISLNIQPLSA